PSLGPPAGAVRRVRPAPPEAGPPRATPALREKGTVCGDSRPDPQTCQLRCATLPVARPVPARPTPRRRWPDRPEPAPSPRALPRSDGAGSIAAHVPAVPRGAPRSARFVGTDGDLPQAPRRSGNAAAGPFRGTLGRWFPGRATRRRSAVT